MKIKHPTARIVENKKDDPCRSPRRGPLRARVVGAQLASAIKQTTNKSAPKSYTNLWRTTEILHKFMAYHNGYPYEIYGVPLKSRRKPTLQSATIYGVPLKSL